MEFFKKNAEIYVPNGGDAEAALKKTTHMAISAHEDDIEIMAIDGIVKTFMKPDASFTAVVATDGAGSARDGRYADYTDEQMKAVRVVEQKKAAMVGDYGALVMLQYSSAEMKNKDDKNYEKDLMKVLDAARPDVIYTHNLADKHDSHIATVIKTIKALREMKGYKPQHIYGCEVWRNLDWLNDDEKVYLDCSAHPNLSRALSSVFDSQIIGGKRYDLAAEGRRFANATFSESHACDTYSMLNYAMDLTPIVKDKTLDIVDHVAGYIKRFESNVKNTIQNYIE